MTLIEVVIALAITGLTVAGIVAGYIYCTTSAVKAELVQAASARAMERIEEARSAKWDTPSGRPSDQLVATNFPDEVVSLDMPGSGSEAHRPQLRRRYIPDFTHPAGHGEFGWIASGNSGESS